MKQKEKSDEAAKRLQAEIQYIKAQKVGMHFGSSLYLSTRLEISYWNHIVWVI